MSSFLKKLLKYKSFCLLFPKINSNPHNIVPSGVLSNTLDVGQKTTTISDKHLFFSMFKQETIIIEGCGFSLGIMNNENYSEKSCN
jgi:hypothetical protein